MVAQARRIGRLVALLLVIAACGATSSAPDKGEAPLPPDEQALARETYVKAQVVKLVLSERWRAKTRVTGGEAEARSEEGATVVTRTGATELRLMGLRVEATSQLRISWLGKDHDNVLLHATDVSLFNQKETFHHSTENMAAVTMANDTVRYWQQ